MMPSPLVSVIMLTYNRPQLIGRAIASVAAQDFDGWELIIVHDGPNEHTVQVASEWAARDSRIRYLHRAKGGNIANATNYGLSQARGDYIAILDDDDYWATSTKLGRQVGFLNANSGYVACGGGMIVIGPDGRETMRFLKPETDAEIRRNALFANPMAHSTTLYRRSAVEHCGGYDESLAGFQDWDVWLKLGRIGSLYNIPDYLTYYQLWDGSGTFQAQSANTRSALRIVNRHRGFYRGYAVACAMAWAYHAYAHLPAGLRRASYRILSQWKKAAFAGRRKT
jgi:glycosyltransferase involved in cell wall biosynthesis